METTSLSSSSSSSRSDLFPQSLRNISALMLASLVRAAAANNNNNNNSRKEKKKKNYLLKMDSYHHHQLLQLLNQLHLSLLSEKPTPNPNPSSSHPIVVAPPHLTLPVPILSLLPLLLTSKCADVVCKSAEFVGAASLFSLEMNEQIAKDAETVKALISALFAAATASSSKKNKKKKKKKRKRCTSTSTSSKTSMAAAAACNAILDMSTTSIGRQRLLQSSALHSLM